MRTRLYDVMTSRMPSGDVLPRSVGSDFPDRAWVNPKPYGDGQCLIRRFANIINIGRGKFFVMNFIPTLFHHVLRVVFFCSKEQVVRVAALWVIATVKNKQTVRNRTILNLPCNSWGNFGFSIQPKPSVSQRGRAPGPYPAHFMGSNLNLGPESFRHRNKSSRVCYFLHSPVLFDRPSLGRSYSGSAGQNMGITHRCAIMHNEAKESNAKNESL